MITPKLLVLDFETYFDREFSLRKLTIPQYAHDPRFHVHGLAVCYPDGSTEFRTDVQRVIDELRAAYGHDLEQISVVCHNAAFDLYLANHRFGLRPRYFLDTMLLAYHVHGRRNGAGGSSASLKDLATRYGLTGKGDLEFMLGVRNPDGRQVADLTAYARNDAELTHALAIKLLSELSRPGVEIKLMTHTIRLFTEGGITVDVEGISRLRESLRAETDGYLRAANLTPEAASNNQQFVPLLEATLARTGRKVALKPGKRGPIPAVAKKDPEMLSLLEDDDPVVAALAEARLKCKSETSLLARLQTLENITSTTGGLLPPTLVYCAAHTGRFGGGGKFNIQNLGRGGFGGEVRKLLRPRPGHVFVIGDYAQIEARITAWYAGEEELLAAFAEGRDVYSEFAAEAFGCEVRKPVEADSPQVRADLAAKRQVGKAAVLGLGFSMGSLKFMNTLRADASAAKLFDSGVLDPVICRNLVKAFREKFARIKGLWSGLEGSFRDAMDGVSGSWGPLHFEARPDQVRVVLPSGRVLRYDGVRLDHTPRIIQFLNKWGQEDELTPDGPSIVYGAGKGIALYGGKLAENIVQATARDLLVEAVLGLEGAGHKVLFHVHDEVIVEAPEADGQSALAAVEDFLSRVPSWAAGLPIGCEVKIAAHYGK